MTNNSADYVLGIMSGSSLDGIDLAVCKIRKDKSISCDLLSSDFISFPKKLRETLLRFKDFKLEGMEELNVWFTKFVAQSISKFLTQQKYETDYISFHGHTLLHRPEKSYSFQLGSGGLLAALTNLPVICDYRTIDIGLGGTGAPLAPLVDTILHSDCDFSINLGGIANITSLSSKRIIAFDICPCNQILNWLSGFEGLEYDPEGQIASSGVIDYHLFEILSSNDFQAKSYPKSLDNEWISNNIKTLFTEPEKHVKNYLRTTVYWISVEIKKAIRMVISKEQTGKENYSCLIAGGGTHNTFLVSEMKQILKEINTNLIIPDREIIDYKEAILMSLLGFCRKNNIVNTFKDVTGASRDSIGGAIYQGVSKYI